MWYAFHLPSLVAEIEPSMSRTVRRRLALLGLPGAVVLLSLSFVVVLAGDLPDPVATHFGPDGTADGFMSLAGFAVVSTIMQVVLWGLLGALVAAQGRQVAGGRALLGIPAGMVGFVATLSLTTLLPQRGLDDPTQVTIDTATMGLAIAVGVGLGLLASLVAPPEPPADATTAAPPADRPRVDVEGAAVWRGRTPSGRALPVAVTLVAVLGAGLWWFAGAIIGLLTLLPVVALVTSLRFGVTIGPGGVVVRGILGYPRTHVPLEVIRDADVETVAPFRQYGGWGWRHRPGRTAVVTAHGPGLLVTRTDGAQLIVSLDEAARAAGVLNRLLDQRGANSAADAST